jgi:hypothetical protein
VLVASSAEVAENSHDRVRRHPGRGHRPAGGPPVRRLRHPDTGGQLEIDIPIWRHHALLTDRTEPLLTVEAEHREHAVVEQTIAELKANALAHLPSGSFWANAAWLTLAAMARTTSAAPWPPWPGTGSTGRRWTTLRRTLLAVPGRLVHSARRWQLQLPTDWPCGTGAEPAAPGAQPARPVLTGYQN